MADQESRWSYATEKRTAKISDSVVDSRRPLLDFNGAGAPFRHEKETSGMEHDLAREFVRLTLLARGPGAKPSLLVDSFPRLSMDLWLNILDKIDSTHDLLSLSRSCLFMYNLCMPRLYSSIRIRMPLYMGDPSGTFSFFDKDSIPMNILMPSNRERMMPSRFPPLGSWAPHVKKLEITKWTSPAVTAPTIPPTTPIKPNKLLTLGPELMIYNIWSGYVCSRGIACLWIGSPSHQPELVFSVDQALAEILKEQMKNLRSFAFLPERLPLVDHNRPDPGLLAPLQDVLHRGYIHHYDKPGLTHQVLDALKGLPRLRELTIDFDQADPLLRERVPSYIPQKEAIFQYRPEEDGLIGFENLSTLDLRGIGCARDSDRRFPEIARVVSDCIATGSLQNFSLAVEEWWYRYVLHHKFDDEKGLLEWYKDLWDRCFRRAEKWRRENPGSPLLRINVSIDFWSSICKFRSSLDYTFRVENLVELRVHTGMIHPHVLVLLNQITGARLPNLRVVSLKCFLKDVYRFLGSFYGLTELYILNPAPVERLRVRELPLHIQRIARGEDKIQPQVKQVNMIMDKIISCHLRTLQVLVIDEFIPVPMDHAEYPKALNSLKLWKGRGQNIRELGLRLWGPWGRVEDFLVCFPALKYFNYFNCPTLDIVPPIPGAPRELFGEPLMKKLPPFVCNGIHTAVLISRVWARELIAGRSTDNRRSSTAPVSAATRWISVGPWYSRETRKTRCRWNEDDASKYLDWTKAPDTMGLAVEMGIAGLWRYEGTEDSKMWPYLDRYIP